jgi:cellulose synthase/poly-beta-1,6-N-acetylglucosamine synthase-like glycosyltransferase
MKSEIQNADPAAPTLKATAHLFEYTTTFGLDANLRFRYPEKGVVPTQILLCIKEGNQRKINSHRWFFNAFAPLLQVCVRPKFCLITFLIGDSLAQCLYLVGCRD